MRSVEIAGNKVGGIEISTDLSPIERRVGAACAVAKWKMGDDHLLFLILVDFARKLHIMVNRTVMFSM